MMREYIRPTTPTSSDDELGWADYEDEDQLFVFEACLKGYDLPTPDKNGQMEKGQRSLSDETRLRSNTANKPRDKEQKTKMKKPKLRRRSTEGLWIGRFAFGAAARGRLTLEAIPEKEVITKITTPTTATEGEGRGSIMRRARTKPGSARSEQTQVQEMLPLCSQLSGEFKKFKGIP